MTMRIGSIIGVAGIIGLTGCATAQPLGSPAVATPGMPNIQTALNRAIARTDAAVRQLDGVPVTELASARLPAVVPAELQQPIGWNYHGHLVPAVRALAKIVGYQAIVERARPHRPIPVAIDVHHVPVITVIRELGIQAGSSADVSIDPRTHTISVIEAAPGTATTDAVTPAPAAVPANPVARDVDPGGPMIRARPVPALSGTIPQQLQSD